jgi:uncharacterized membrane protein
MTTPQVTPQTTPYGIGAPAGVPAGAPTTGTLTARPARARLDSVDLLRGLVMVIMLLDHTRDLVHEGSFAYDPLDLQRTTVALFLTRWITHFCAPVFVFLAGAGAYFQRRRGKPLGELRHFLWTRGLWLMFLEITVVRAGMIWNVDFRMLAWLQVIFALGVSMVCLAALVGLPTRVVGAIGVAIVALHNTLDGVRVPTWNGPDSPVPSVAAKLWMLLHQGGPFPIAGWPSPIVIAFYPLLAWVGVMAAGYAFGGVYDLEPAARRRTLLRLGLGLTAAFVVLRALDIYGDPLGWHLRQPRGAVFTVLSFLNTQKYPPSLLFALMTLGPSITLLGMLDGRLDSAAARRAPARWLVTFGRVPLFYYVLQWPTAHAAGFLLTLAAGKPTWPYFANQLDLFIRGGPKEFGFPLWVVYLCWIAGVVLLYQLCRWYAGVKARRNDWWLSYL